jgi:hypothetical protein
LNFPFSLSSANPQDDGPKWLLLSASSRAAQPLGRGVFFSSCEHLGRFSLSAFDFRIHATLGRGASNFKTRQAEQAAEKVDYFVIPSEARNLPWF